MRQKVSRWIAPALGLGIALEESDTVLLDRFRRGGCLHDAKCESDHIVAGYDDVLYGSCVAPEDGRLVFTWMRDGEVFGRLPMDEYEVVAIAQANPDKIFACGYAPKPIAMDEIGARIERARRDMFRENDGFPHASSGLTFKPL